MANATVIAPVDSGSRVRAPERIGPYTLYDEIGCGGMAAVHLGKLRSPSGFTRIVAIKRMHPDLARSPEFVAMFFEEARLIARIHHPNVVAALDCVALDNTAMLVMDYVHGISLDQLMRDRGSDLLPPAIASAIMVGAALGLHAAHEAVDDNGKTLGIVHRDVSPHNILVGVDGLPRVLDFGIAKAAERAHHTRTGEVKGKLGYMAPEQLFQSEVGREADVYALGVILWELATGRRLFANDSHGQMMMRIANSVIDSPRSVNPQLSSEVEAVIMKALARAPEARYRTAFEFATAVEACMPPAYQRVVGEWISSTASEELHHRTEIRAKIDLSMTGRIQDASDSEAVVTSRLRLPAIVGEDGAAADQAKPPRWRSPRTMAVAAIGAVAVATGLALWPRPAPPPEEARNQGPAASAAPAASGADAPSASAAQAPAPSAEARTAAAGGEPPAASANAGTGSAPGTTNAATQGAEAQSVGNRWAPRPATHGRMPPPRVNKGAPANGAPPPAVAPTPGGPESDFGVIGGRE